MGESPQLARANRAVRVDWLKKHTNYGNNTALQLMTDDEVRREFLRLMEEKTK